MLADGELSSIYLFLVACVHSIVNVPAPVELGFSTDVAVTVTELGVGGVPGAV